MSLYGDIVRRVLVALLIVLSITMEEDEEMVGRQLNSLGVGTFVLSQLYENHKASYCSGPLYYTIATIREV